MLSLCFEGVSMPWNDSIGLPSKGEDFIKEKILNTLTDSPQTCKEIAQKTDLNTQTVSRYLRQNLKDEVIQIAHQHNCYPCLYLKRNNR